MIHNPMLKLSDLVLGLERFGDRYGAIDVFADDVLELRTGTPVHGLRALDEEGKRYQYDPSQGGSYVLDLVPQLGVVRLSRASAPPRSHAESDPGAVIAGALAGAAIGAALSKKGEGAAAGLVLGLLAGAALSRESRLPETPRRVFTLRFDPTLGQWRAYDGGLVPWMKDNLLTLTAPST